MSTADLHGRVVLVTGGARGVGRAVCRAFADRGAHVIVNYFHSREEAPGVLADLRAAGASAELARASVADHAQVEAMFADIGERHGRLDVLVNNAAAGALLPLDELHASQWQRAFDTNLRGSLWCSQAAAPLLAAGGGAIVNLSSIGSSMVITDYAAVGTSKAALEALTRYLAVEYAPRGIRVNTASAGLLDGRVAALFPDASRLADVVRRATPLGQRLGREDELAELVVFLASPSASWITGQTVVADGGLSLGSALLSPGAAAQSPAQPGPEPLGDEHQIAVVGMGVVTPGANDPDELWRLLCGERNVFGEPELFDIDSFYSPDPGAEDRTYTRHSGFIRGFRPHPALRAELDAGALPSHESTTLWLRHSVHTAVTGVGRSATDRYFAAFGYTADGSQDLETGLVLAGYRRRLGGDPAGVLRQRYQRHGTAPREFLPHRVGRNAIAGLLPDETELLMVDTACSSSLYSVDLGVKALRDGSCDIAVCGGAYAYTARSMVLFSKLHGLSRSGEVRSFDRDADGVLFSDGAGVVVLKRLGRARADGDRVLGVISGIGLSCDGRGKAIYAPNTAGQARALRRAHTRAGLESADWVIAHATGTPAGDRAEVTSLCEAAGGGRPALLSSNKPIVGHTGWTAGVVSLVQALTGLSRGVVPAQRYLREPIEILRNTRFTPPSRESALPAGAAVGLSSFGFGGTNAHVLLGRHSPPADVHAEDVVVVGWSADVPGDVEVSEWLTGNGPAPAASFGDSYPLPPFSEVRLPPATLRGMDRTQIMLLSAAGRLPRAVREVCLDLRDTAGVVVGHMGQTRQAVHYALRCYLGDLAECLGGALPAELVDEVHALVPATTEDSGPGVMPNIIAARLAALWDLHGLNATVDTGPDSSRDAIRCAERYLRHGDSDVVVVAGVNGNTTPEFAEVLAEDRELAEGCFVVVLMRESTATAHGLPVLLRNPSPTTARNGRTYLGADHILELLRSLARGAPPIDRVARRLAPTPATSVRAPLPAIPDDALVLTTGPVAAPDSARVVVVPESDDPAVLAGTLPVGGVRHVRVIAAVDACASRLDDPAAIDQLRRLHDLAFLAAGRWTPGSGGSFGVLLTDSVRDCAPHPATGMFTGLVKALAREEPEGLSFAVLTDRRDGLDLLAAESANGPELFVSVHSGGTRHEYVLEPSQPASAAEPPDVVVAAGGTRGLTAEVLAALAARDAPMIYLLGRHAPAEHAVERSRAEHIARARAENPQRSVAEVSAEYDRMCASAETGRTVRRLAALCGRDRVRHVVCDLTDADAVRAAVDLVHAEHPRVDLLINAGGIHHGGTVRSTPLEVARRVRDTKLLGYLNLHRAFTGRAPALWCNFGSVLSVLGWPGEAAYCSGNDVLLAAANWHRQTAGRSETTIAWPPWDEAGFAAAPLTRQLLRERGTLSSLSNEDGSELFLTELSYRGADAEVTFVGPPERRLLRPAADPSVWSPDPRRDSYLDCHLLDGTPTLPGALVLERFTRALGRRGPVELRDVRFHAPVSAPSGVPTTYRLTVDGSTVQMLSDVVTRGGTVLRRNRLHASGQALPACRPTAPPVAVPSPRGRSAPVRRYTSGEGRVRLSGPFASLTDLRWADGRGTARFAPELGDWEAVFGEFGIPALLLDALIQLTLLAGGDRPMPVPQAIGRVEVLTEHNDVELLALHPAGITLVADGGISAAFAPDQTPLLTLVGVEFADDGPPRSRTTSILS